MIYSKTTAFSEAKIGHKAMGTCAIIEISQYADNEDQKVKSFLKVHKTYKLLWEARFQLSFFPSFYSGSHFTNLSIFIPLKIKFKQRKIINIIIFFYTSRIFLQFYQVSALCLLQLENNSNFKMLPYFLYSLTPLPSGLFPSYKMCYILKEAICS